jgi:protein arginine N-methyltransferase 1
MRLSDATIFLDELMTAYLLPDTACQYIWSKLDVHRTLLKDGVRVNAFNQAIKERVKVGDRVLDLGTGTGILAFLAAKAGAGEVIGVDSASIIDAARRTAEKNSMLNVKFIRGDIRDLDIEKVDCIICELIGMYITDEGITYKMRNALRLLKDGGTVIPARIDVFIVPVESNDAGLGFWRKLYGIDYSAVDRVPHEIRNYDMSEARFLSQPQRMSTIDLTAKGKSRLEYEGEFEITSDGEFHGCVVYFNAKLSENVTLSTHPKEPLTHWKQVFLPNDCRMKVKVGDRLKADVRVVYRNTRWRWRYSLV